MPISQTGGRLSLPRRQSDASGTTARRFPHFDTRSAEPEELSRDTQGA